MQRNSVAMTFDDRFFLPDEVFELISRNSKVPQCGNNEVSNYAQLNNAPPLATVVQNDPRSSSESTLDMNEYHTDWQQLRPFVDRVTCLNQSNENLFDITEHENCPDDRTCYNLNSRHDHPDLAPQSLKNFGAPSRRNRIHSDWYLSSWSGAQPLVRQQRVFKTASEKDGAHNEVGETHQPPENVKTRGKRNQKPATWLLSPKQSSETANDFPARLPHSPSHVVQHSLLREPLPTQKERIIGEQDFTSCGTVDSPLPSRISRYDRLLPNPTTCKLQRSVSSHSRIRRYSVLTRAKTAFRYARRISKHECRESIFTSAVMPHTQKLKALIQVERLKKELAKMAIGPDYYTGHTHRGDRSRRSNSKHSEESGKHCPERSKKALQKYSVDSDAAPRTVRRHRHRRSLSKALHRSHSLHSSPCGGVVHEQPSGTHRFATNIAEKRRAEMASVRDLWNASVAPCNVRSFDSLKSSMKSTDFTAMPPQRICQYFDRVRRIDFDNSSTDYDNVNGSVDRRHYRTFSKTKEDGSCYMKDDRLQRSDRVDRENRKFDQGLLVEVCNDGRSLRRIKTDLVREQRFSLSCDHLNIPSLQNAHDNGNYSKNYSGMSTFNYISDCCPDISEFQPPFYTLPRLSSADVIERRLRRSATSSCRSFPCSCGCETRMMNLSNNKHDNETCFEALDDGTESLDRRGWQQRAHALGGHNGSAHNLMSMSAINGSNSFYQEGPGVAIVDGPTTPQRLANFFARPFRTNPLKRTKSVSKLDRKRTPNDPDYTSSRPELQRSQENVCTLGSSSLYGNRWPIGGCNGQSCAEHNPLRSCRSHESLLSYSTTSHMIDMGAADVRIHAVHPSVLDVPNCFKVANTYYACRTPMERNRWIENLRRTMNPRRDEMRRTENALEIWILEAKGVPVKRRYYCEICLDKTLVGRTSAKPRADICFWGEHFDYSPIPKVDDLCINLYRDADPKKKKDRSTLIGYVQIKIDQLTARHPVERWYTVTASSDGSKLPGLGKDKGEAAAIRIKARYQSVDILPMYMYDELLRFVRLRYLSLCLALEPLLGVRAKEDFATALVRIMHKQRMAKEFLCDLIMCEVDVLDNEHLMFRGNSLATKAMEAYMKLVADEYLKETLGEFVKSILESDDICEVDPLKMVANNQATLERNRQHLTFNVEAAWGKIVNSTSSFPLELRDIFDSLRRRLEQADRRDLADTLISSSIFLRFLCPAILSPSLFNLVSEYPSGSAARNLTLIAKTLQTLANFTKFGGKEHYMEFMNEFVTREWDNMHHYLMRISTAPPRSEKQSASGEWDACVDLGKEISLLHSYLDEIWTEEVHEQAIAHDRSLEEIRKILSRLDMRRQSGDSSIDLRDYDSRNAQSPASDYDNAGILRSRNHNVPAYPYVHGTGQAQVMSRSTPASHLGTNDDYVLDIALLNDSLAIRHAGICVQQHRNGQHKNHRHPVDASPREQTTQRNAISPHHPVDDDGRPRLTAYHSNENASAATTSSSVSRTSTKSYSTATTDRHNDEDTDSDDAVGPQTRHARPPRKGKRRANGQQSRNETPTRTNVVASQPPSSGYQSQNHSSSLSSSNSSSPVERSTMVPGSEPQSALKIANKMFTSHTPMPSTSYPPTYDQMVMGPRAAAENTSPVPSTDLTTYYRTTGFSTTSENAGVHEVGKCSLPRTNPRYSGRSSFGASMNAGVVKPTLIDVGIESDTDVVTATPVRAAGVLIENNNDAKQYDGVWAIPEQRSNISERWTNAYPCDASLQQSQQEIIEQQKREIMRLMRENEELKKHVAAQQNTSQKPSSIASKTIDSQPFADSGASEDSYDSLSSFSDHTAALPQKAATHC